MAAAPAQDPNTIQAAVGSIDPTFASGPQSGPRTAAPAPAASAPAPVTTPPAAATPPPAGSTPSPYYSRYSADPTTLIAPTPQSEEDIQASKTAQAQDQINGLNSYYADLSAQQKTVNDQNDRSTASVDTLTGLAGSTEANKNQQATTVKDQAALKAISDEGVTKVQDILSQIRADAATEARNQRLDYNQSVTESIANKDAIQKQAVGYITNLTAAGVTADGLKSTDPTSYAHLLASYDGNESALKGAFILNTPKDQILTSSVVNGSLVVARQNPITGAITHETVDLGLPTGSVQVADAGGYLLFGKAGADGKWDGNMATTTKINKTLTPDQAATKSGSSGNLTIQDSNGKNVSVPADVAPYYSTSHSGVAYADLSTIQGTAAEKKSIVDQAQAAGIKVITNKNTALDLTNIGDANSKLDSISTIMTGIDQPSALSRDLAGMGLTKFATLAQSNPQQAASGALQGVGLDILKAISGVQGFRGNTSVVQQITDHLPSIYDTNDVVQQKVDYIRQLITDRENAILGQSGSNVSVNEPTNTAKGQTWNRPDGTYVSDGVQWVKQ